MRNQADASFQNDLIICNIFWFVHEATNLAEIGLEFASALT
jgi:hypothetical protein